MILRLTFWLRMLILHINVFHREILNSLKTSFFTKRPKKKHTANLKIFPQNTSTLSERKQRLSRTRE